jgi:hypothetical protein
VTKRAYAEITADETPEIDVTHMTGSRLTAADAALLRKYQDTLYTATYWPCVEHFRDCVAAYDAMVAKP